MTSVSLDELQIDCESMLERVYRGEVLIVTRNGAEVAELRPRHRPVSAAAELIERRRHLPRIDVDSFQQDINNVLGGSAADWT
jgi:prevent-host-death family protein